MRLFSTEQVSRWHPDKYADQISDALLTAYLRGDQHSHCGIETMVKNDAVFLTGEVSSNTQVDVEEVVQDVARKLCYSAREIHNYISTQSPEIANAVDSDENIGAGDQGMMYGYATTETEAMLPFGFDLANRIISLLAAGVDDGILKGDAKTQVTVDLDKQGHDSIHTVLISVCHEEGINLQSVKAAVSYYINELELPKDTRLIINPSGLWTIGGPTADAGLTGRKIVCDQYGGYCPVGGGAFSGKDPSKVDRSASYMARYIAKELCQWGELDQCEVQLAYAIGIAEPVSVGIRGTKQGAAISNAMAAELGWYIQRNYDLTPKGIINKLDLYNKDYELIAEGCHYRGVM